MLADTESEKAKWVVALSELHRILKRNNLPNTAIFRVREVLDSTLSVLRGGQSALIIDPDRILLGTEDGLFCLDLDRSGTYRCSLAIDNTFFFIIKISIIFYDCRNGAHRRK